MTLQLTYPDIATFVKVSPDGYGNSKTILQQVSIPVIFVQNTGFQRSADQDAVNSDAICFPDFRESFIVENADRLEGMFIVVPLFGANNDQSWYKIISVTVNRDHLLGNIIDNVELRLKKTRPIAGVS